MLEKRIYVEATPQCKDRAQKNVCIWWEANGNKTRIGL